MPKKAAAAAAGVAVDRVVDEQVGEDALRVRVGLPIRLRGLIDLRLVKLFGLEQRLGHLAQCRDVKLLGEVLHRACTTHSARFE